MSYLSTVQADAPVHFWRLSEPHSFIAHDIGSLTPVHLLGGVTPIGGFSGIAADGGSFFFGAALPLWNTDSLAITVPCTVEFWYWAHYTSSTLVEVLIGWDEVASPSLAINKTTSGAIQANITAGGLCQSAALTPQRWRHVVFVVSGTANTLYVDGALVQTTPVVFGGPFTRKLAVGTDGNKGFPCNAFITEVAIYQTALSAARAAAHYAAQEVTAPPVQLTSGRLDLVTGAAEPASADLSAILAAVRRPLP